MTEKTSIWKEQIRAEEKATASAYVEDMGNYTLLRQEQEAWSNSIAAREGLRPKEEPTSGRNPS